MSMSEITDEIKRKLDIVGLIQEYVQLKRAGASLKGLCPFHREKTPSFIVSAERQSWHCFGCSKGGDAFTFLQEIEGVDFPEALRLLAQRTNTPLPKFNPEQQSERARLAELVRDAARFFYTELHGSRGREALAYLERRGVKPDTLRTWKLGYAPDAWDALLQNLNQKGYRTDEIVKAGLALERENRSGAYDRFRHRVMFPLSDVHGTIVGFTGRALVEGDGGKYVNTPTTLLYDKSRMVYGLDLAKDAIKQAGKIVLVEGQMDAISSHQAGIQNVVAVSGTALTREQIQLIKRFTSTFVLAFDQDVAGSQAMLRGLELCWEEGVTLEMLTLPTGKDPDACVQENPALWRQAITDAVPFLTYLFQHALKQYDVTTIAGRKDTTHFLLSFLVRIADPIERSLWLGQLANLVGVEERILRESIDSHRAKQKRAAPDAATVAPAVKRPPADNFQQRFFGIIAGHPKLFSAYSVELDPEFFDEPFRTLARRLKEEYAGIDLTSEHILQCAQGFSEDLGRGLRFLVDEFSDSPPHDIEREATLLFARLRRAYYARCLQDVTRQLRMAEERGDDAAIGSLLEQCQQLMHKLHG